MNLSRTPHDQLSCPLALTLSILPQSLEVDGIGRKGERVAPLRDSSRHTQEGDRRSVGTCPPGWVRRFEAEFSGQEGLWSHEGRCTLSFTQRLCRDGSWRNETVDEVVCLG